MAGRRGRAVAARVILLIGIAEFVALSGAPSDQQASRVTLKATGGLPAHIVGTFRDRIVFPIYTSERLVGFIG